MRSSSQRLLLPAAAPPPTAASLNSPAESDLSAGFDIQAQALEPEDPRHNADCGAEAENGVP